MKIAVWKNHEGNLDVADKKWVNHAIVLTSLKVGGAGSEDNTELTTTMASRIWAAPPELKDALNARASSADQITSISKAYEGGTPVDYSAIDGESVHLSTLASLLVPNVSASLPKTHGVCSSYEYVKQTHAQVPR